MYPIKITKHISPIPIYEHGDILKPFENWETTTTGAGWYSKLPEEYYDTKPYYPLTAIAQNSWEALYKLGVDCKEFKEQIKYTCPYNGYVHYWCIPVLIFTKDIKLWTSRYAVPRADMYSDDVWMRKIFPPKTKNGLSFTKIQRALLGPGYTDMTSVNDGNSYLYDALVSLDNEDFLGVKVWMWFNKNR